MASDHDNGQLSSAQLLQKMRLIHPGDSSSSSRNLPPKMPLLPKKTSSRTKTTDVPKNGRERKNKSMDADENAFRSGAKTESQRRSNPTIYSRLLSQLHINSPDQVRLPTSRPRTRSHSNVHRGNDPRTLSAMLRLVNHESTRADASEKDVETLISCARELKQRKTRAETELVGVRAELEMYKRQFTEAQREIYRAQDIVQGIDRARAEAEEGWAKEREKFRELETLRAIDEAREEGRRQGWTEGVRQGRQFVSDRSIREEGVFLHDEEMEEIRQVQRLSSRPRRASTNTRSTITGASAHPVRPGFSRKRSESTATPQSLPNTVPMRFPERGFIRSESEMPDPIAIRPRSASRPTYSSQSVSRPDIRVVPSVEEGRATSKAGSYQRQYLGGKSASLPPVPEFGHPQLPESMSTSMARGGSQKERTQPSNGDFSSGGGSDAVSRITSPTLLSSAREGSKVDTGLGLRVPPIPLPEHKSERQRAYDAGKSRVVATEDHGQGSFRWARHENIERPTSPIVSDGSATSTHISQYDLLVPPRSLSPLQRLGAFEIEKVRPGPLNAGRNSNRTAANDEDRETEQISSGQKHIRGHVGVTDERKRTVSTWSNNLLSRVLGGPVATQPSSSPASKKRSRHTSLNTSRAPPYTPHATSSNEVKMSTHTPSSAKSKLFHGAERYGGGQDDKPLSYDPRQLLPDPPEEGSTTPLRTDMFYQYRSPTPSSTGSPYRVPTSPYANEATARRLSPPSSGSVVVSVEPPSRSPTSSGATLTTVDPVLLTPEHAQALLVDESELPQRRMPGHLESAVYGPRTVLSAGSSNPTIVSPSGRLPPGFIPTSPTLSISPKAGLESPAKSVRSPIPGNRKTPVAGY